jgi:hypothetical protein
MMNKKILDSHINVILALGSIWGLSEVMMGMWLHKCAVLYSGAIMTGLAFFYMAFAWTATKRLLSLVILLIIVSLFKLLDAWLLSTPVISGSVANPMFAFFTEILAFMVMILLLRDRFFKKGSSRFFTGGGAAVIAISLFPAVGMITGIPACLYPSTQVPLSLATSPVAVIISMLTVPLGFFLADRYLKSIPILGNKKLSLAFRYGWAPLFFIMCLGFLTLYRVI